MGGLRAMGETFLSSLAQDFIEDGRTSTDGTRRRSFLSSLAQDFIEEIYIAVRSSAERRFLSSLAQDFIEEASRIRKAPTLCHS